MFPGLKAGAIQEEYYDKFMRRKHGFGLGVNDGFYRLVKRLKPRDYI